MKAVKRNGKIELMRFIMCIIVVIYHSELSINGDFLPRFFNVITLSKHGCIGVEFFFVLSGFFMAKAAEKDYLAKQHGGVNDTVNFFFKRYAAVIPFQIISFFIIYFINVIIYKPGFTESMKNLYESLPDLFLFCMIGVPYEDYNGVAWYLSAMLIGFMIIYPWLRYNYYKFSRYFAPVISFLLLVFLFFSSEPIRLSGVYKMYGFIRVANIRACAELLLGVVSFELSKKLGKLRLSESMRKVLFAVEIILILSLIIYVFSPLSEAWQFLFLFVCAAFITLALSGATYGNEKFDKRWIYYLGKLSLPVYLIQYAFRDIAMYYLNDIPFGLYTLLIVLAAVLLGAILMPLGNKLVEKTTNLFRKIHLVY